MKNKARLTEGHILFMLIRLTLPMILGMFSMVAFNLADTFFVAKLGTLQLAALSFTFPVVLILNSIALGIGVGTSAVISRAIGSNDTENVKRLTTDSLILGVLLTLIVAVLGMLTIDPLFTLLGADAETLPLIRSYMMIWYPGIVFVVIPMIGNSAIRASGNMLIPGLIMTLSALLNIIMDPLLIFGIGFLPRLEIEGAALATIGARGISMLCSLSILYFHQKMITFSRTVFENILTSWKKILYIGIPASLTQLIMPLGVGVITAILARSGNSYVAAYGVASRIEFFILAPIMALSTVMNPFIGQNLGSNNIQRISSGVKSSYLLSTIWIFIVSIIVILFRTQIASIFAKEQIIISIIIFYMLILIPGYFFQGVFIINNQSFNGLHLPLFSGALMVIEIFVLAIPFAFLGRMLYDWQGVFIGLSIAYILAGVISVTTMNLKLKKL